MSGITPVSKSGWVLSHDCPVQSSRPVAIVGCHRIGSNLYVGLRVLYEAYMPGSLSLAVVESVATTEGIDETELEPLAHTIDTDALDGIFRNGTGTITFHYQDYEVTVEHRGRVEAVPLFQR